MLRYQSIKLKYLVSITATKDSYVNLVPVDTSDRYRVP